MEQFLIHLTVAQFQDQIKTIVSEILLETKTGSKKTISPEYATRKEVCEKIHVSLPTLNRMNRDQILKAHKISGRVLYIWDEVYSAIQQPQAIKYRRKSNV